MTWILGLSLLLFSGALVTQSSPDLTVMEGSKVTLQCHYDKSYSNPDLYWYRRRPDHSLQFILYRDNTRSTDADFVQGRFSVLHNKDQGAFHLEIAAVRVEDGSVYYCVVKPTVMQRSSRAIR
uniref:T cell receptor delta variable 3 n=1 Tax=Ornithorhynchus anatinus TaxID=9258 RepID=F6ZNU1_ORNAN